LALRQRLTNLFGRGDRLARLARGRDRTAFLDLLGRTEIHVLSTPDPVGLDATNISKAELLSHIEREAAQFAQMKQNDEAATPFFFRADDRICFPIFSTEEAAGEFVCAYVNAVNRTIAFHLLSMVGRHLAGVISPEITVILNAMTKLHFALFRRRRRTIHSNVADGLIAVTRPIWRGKTGFPRIGDSVRRASVIEH
jgi:hypothetical protein